MARNHLARNRNSLSLWVSRHTALSTLFQSPHVTRPASVGTPLSEPGVLYPTHPAGDQTIVPPAEFAAPAFPPAAQSANIQRQAIPTPASTPRPAPPPLSTPPPPPAPAAEEEKTTPKEWRRLQTILHRHEAHQLESTPDVKETPQSARSQPATSQVAASQIPPTQAAQEISTGSPMHNPHSGQEVGMEQDTVRPVPAKRRAEVTYVQPDVQRTEAHEKTSETRPQPLKADVASEPASPSASTVDDSPSPLAPPPSVENPITNEAMNPENRTPGSATVVQRSLSQANRPDVHDTPESAPEKTVGDTSPTVVPVDASAESGDEVKPTDIIARASADVIQRSRFDEPRTPLESGKEIEAEQALPVPQNIPLQDAWPVSRVDLPENITAQRLTADTPVGASSEPIQMRPSLMADSQERLISSEEPISNSKLTEIRPSTQVNPPSPSTPALSIQRTGIPEDENIGLPQQESSEPTPVTHHGAAYVETPVGPLPPDLWQFLDKEPPASPSGPLATPHSPSAMPAPTQSIAPTADPASHTVSPAASIQRQPQEGASPAQSTQAANTTATSETGDTGSNSSPDIEGLARQVYAILRRRLITEWERMRR